MFSKKKKYIIYSNIFTVYTNSNSDVIQFLDTQNLYPDCSFQSSYLTSQIHVLKGTTKFYTKKKKKSSLTSGLPRGRQRQSFVECGVVLKCLLFLGVHSYITISTEHCKGNHGCESDHKKKTIFWQLCLQGSVGEWANYNVAHLMPICHGYAGTSLGLWFPAATTTHMIVPHDWLHLIHILGY